LIGFDLALFGQDLLYCIAENLNEDREQLKFLVLLRNTCKHLKIHVPRVYIQLQRLYKLQTRVHSWLHEMAYTIAPTLNFHTIWRRNHFEFSVQFGPNVRTLLWTARSKYESLYIVDCPWKAPYVCFELMIFPAPEDNFGYMSHESKMGPPSLKQTKLGADKLEAILIKYKETLSQQLLKIKEEVQLDEDYYDHDTLDADDFISEHGEFDQPHEHPLVVEDVPKMHEDSEVIIITDDLGVTNAAQGGLITELDVILVD
jgi:hypothetical protein